MRLEMGFSMVRRCWERGCINKKLGGVSCSCVVVLVCLCLCVLFYQVARKRLQLVLSH